MIKLYICFNSPELWFCLQTLSYIPSYAYIIFIYTVSHTPILIYLSKLCIPTLLTRSHILTSYFKVSLLWVESSFNYLKPSSAQCKTDIWKRNMELSYIMQQIIPSLFLPCISPPKLHLVQQLHHHLLQFSLPLPLNLLHQRTYKIVC